MVKVLPNPAVSVEGGSTMIEVLVAIVVLTLGLLGLAGLQARLQVSEMEAYQRSQALILVSDMASRLAANRAGAAAYVAAAPVSGLPPPPDPRTCPTATGTQAQRDIKEWCDALQGASETKASGTVRLGTLVGGLGCIEDLGAGDYRVTVTWQGLVPIAERALGSGGASPLCGNNAYAGGTSCTGNLCRRYVTMLVRVPTL